MIIAGAQSLEAHKEIVNSLNVFPVPDGDTGTNMALTMKSAVKEVKSTEGNSLDDLANAAANGSLMGARGNSGVILSQLFRGFAKSVQGKNHLNTVDLAEALKSGSDTAYKAVMKPVEGTILTVARESAEKAIEIAATEKDMVVFIEKVIEEAGNTLERTPDMLQVLKEAGVVDSGGKGLLYIYKGALAALTGKTIIVEDEDIAQQTYIHEDEAQGQLEFGYCTEFIIKSKEVDIEAFKSTIKGYGDSMLAVGNENIVKVHIHTNHPGEVMEHALKLGQLSDIKIDNMRLQHRHQLMEQDTDTNKVDAKSRLKPYGFITVAMGEGLSKIFKDFQVDHVIEGGQTMNPSTQDFVEAIENINAETVFIMPNNSNIIMAANQAKDLSAKNILVIPTKTIPQGISALLAFNNESTPEENYEEMLEAITHVRTGQITYAVRDTSFNEMTINEGDIIGIGEKEIKSVGQDMMTVSLELLDKIVEDDTEMITVFYGQDVTEKEANQIVQRLEAIYGDLDIEIYYGGQPLYYYIFSVE